MPGISRDFAAHAPFSPEKLSVEDFNHPVGQSKTLVIGSTHDRQLKCGTRRIILHYVKNMHIPKSCFVAI